MTPKEIFDKYNFDIVYIPPLESDLFKQQINYGYSYNYLLLRSNEYNTVKITEILIDFKIPIIFDYVNRYDNNFQLYIKDNIFIEYAMPMSDIEIDEILDVKNNIITSDIIKQIKLMILI